MDVAIPRIDGWKATRILVRRVPLARSIFAVIAGLCCILAVTIGLDAVVPMLIPNAFLGPDGGGAVGLLLLTVFYATVATALGGFLTASMVTHHRSLHALVLGALSLLLMVAATRSFGIAFRSGTTRRRWLS